MPKFAYMTYAPPGSGKSYWCKRHPFYTGDNYINMDEIREKYPLLSKKQQWQKAAEICRNLAATKEFVYVDNTHIAKWQWDLFADILRDHVFTIIMVRFSTPVHVCIERNAARERKVPENIIYDFHARMSFLPCYRHDQWIVV